MEERLTLCNMAVEAGENNGAVPDDSTTYKYLEVPKLGLYLMFIKNIVPSAPFRGKKEMVSPWEKSFTFFMDDLK